MGIWISWAQQMLFKTRLVRASLKCDDDCALFKVPFTNSNGCYTGKMRTRVPFISRSREAAKRAKKRDMQSVSCFGVSGDARDSVTRELACLLLIHSCFIENTIAQFGS